MSFRSRVAPARDGRARIRTAGLRQPREESPSRRRKPRAFLRPALAGMACAAVIMYASGWDSTRSGMQAGGAAWRQRDDPMVPLDAGMPALDRVGREWGAGGAVGGGGGGGDGVKEERPAHGVKGQQAPRTGINTRISAQNDPWIGGQTGPGYADPPPRQREHIGEASPYFDEADVAVIADALESYNEFARSTLEADGEALREGRPIQGKYLVLDSGNELVNRLRGVLSGFFLGVLTDRVFVADITYQKDISEGLLSALFEGPGYEWDLSQLSPQLRRALAPARNVRGSDSNALYFDMSEEHFRHWVCDDVLGRADIASKPVVTLSTVVYPFPLLARNPAYASHPIISGAVLSRRAGGATGTAGFAGGGQERTEALETLLTRMVLRPTVELRERARELAVKVREEAAEWGRKRGWGERPPRVVGLHVRTYFVKAVSKDKVERNLEQFADCAVAAGGKEKDNSDIFFFIATDEAETQTLARKVWGEGCFFQDFGLPGSRLEGIKAALVDLLVMGSLDDFVMTPHSSFSELGSSLSHTWLPDPEASIRTRPNHPIVPLFAQMNAFERSKVLSLLDRRASPIPGASHGGGGGACMRAHTAGMSVAIAKGKHLTSMFEAIEQAPCLKGTGDVAAL